MAFSFFGITPIILCVLYFSGWYFIGCKKALGSGFFLVIAHPHIKLKITHILRATYVTIISVRRKDPGPSRQLKKCDLKPFG